MTFDEKLMDLLFYTASYMPEDADDRIKYFQEISMPQIKELIQSVVPKEREIKTPSDCCDKVTTLRSGWNECREKMLKGIEIGEKIKKEKTAR